MRPYPFAYCLVKMTEALAAFETAAAEAERIEADELAQLQAERDIHPHPSLKEGSLPAPVEYELTVALKLHFRYNQASARKASRRDQAIMWGIAALAVAAAGPDPVRPPETRKAPDATSG
jgi:hypothetical protein